MPVAKMTIRHKVMQFANTGVLFATYARPRLGYGLF